ncbi:MAG: amino acid adenylation domain-containing protein, partial [bacterium]|nr:amino acid adenylation domain-containing protein [bacterium]
TVMEGYENEHYDMESPGDTLGENRELFLFNLVFLLENIHKKELIARHIQQRGNELTVSVEKKGGRLEVGIYYNSEKLSESSVRRIAGTYSYILEQVLGDLDVKVGDVELLTMEEKSEILYGFNDTGRDYPGTGTLHEKFACQVDKTPDNTAVISTVEILNYYDEFKPEQIDVRMTYAELDERACDLAVELWQRGIGPDRIVGLMVGHPLEIVVGILGILKAGGAYLPIDPDYPEEMKVRMLQDSNARLLVTEESLQETLPKALSFLPVLTLEDVCEPDPVEAVPEGIDTPGNVAYVIYTSGTGGKPKGTLVEHKSVVNYINWRLDTLRYCEDDVTLQPLSYCFDGFASNFYSSLFSGGALYMVPGAGRLDTDYIGNVLSTHQVTNVSLVPGLYSILLDNCDERHLASLRFVILAGDTGSADLIQKSRQKAPGIQLLNEYGPTETTVTAVGRSHMDGTGLAVIGTPIANVRVYILDECRKPVPVNVPGELYISGTGVARGYLNNPQLTEEKFIVGPYEECQRLYRTGDLARWLPQGEIQFLGRADQQVKIRGFRIEPLGIRRRILEHESVKDAVVLDIDDQCGEKYLCAYIVPAPGKTPDCDQLGESLSAFLPGYMIPTRFVQVDGIPLTANGKVDRNALPVPGVEKGDGYVAPRNEREKQLARMWGEVLKIEPGVIGIDDDFFRLGGHSLKAINFASLVHKAFQVRIPLTRFFECPTIRETALFTAGAVREEYTGIETVEERKWYPLSSAQKRLYFLQRMNKIAMAYNIPALLLLEGAVDRQRLEEAFRQLLQRHESFRTGFETVEEEPVQRIHEQVEFYIRDYDLTSPGKFSTSGRLASSATEFGSPRQKAGEGCGVRFSLEEYAPEVRPVIADFLRPSDLSRPPLLRAAVIKSAENFCFLLVDMHHIISDGISVEIIVNDFTALYAGRELPELKVRYRDFACRQNDGEQEENLKSQRQFWKNQFQGGIPLLNLPADFPRPPVQRYEGNSLAFTLGEEETGKLKALAYAEDTTLYILLLTLFYILLAKLSRDEDIVVGTPVGGRSHTDLQSIVGMFVNTLALRNFPAGHKTVKGFLSEVKNGTLQSFDNQDFQFEDLVEVLAVPRDMSRNPLTDVMFSLQNMEKPLFEAPDLKLTPCAFETDVARFDLTLTALEEGHELYFTFEYSSSIFKKDTIELWSEYFRKIVVSVLENGGQKIDEIEMISAAERKYILEVVNATAEVYPGPETIHGLFEVQVAKTPGNIALKYKDGEITYEQLNWKARGLARALSGMGIVPGSTVGLMVDPSAEMVMAILAVFKAGGAYLPIGPRHPRTRKEYILRDSSTGVLLTTRALCGGDEETLRSLIPGGILYLEDEILYTETDNPEADNHGTGNHATGNPETSSTVAPAGAGDPAYIIYTSGTTGKPKGVAVEHGAAVNLLVSQAYRYPVEETDTYLLKTSYLFDVSLTELFGWFFNGGCLYILEKGKEKDPLQILETIKNETITHINFVPSIFNLLVSRLTRENAMGLASLKYVFLAGEAITPGSVQQFRLFNGSVAIENLYGPTEGTVYASWYSLAHWGGSGSIPIGIPLPNVRLYILDSMDRLQAGGVPGELCIAGAGLARGYLNNPLLTAEKFTANPFEEGERLYRTGDLTRRIGDGNIEYLGRIDQQVKIRGFRIEPGEIESHLLAQPSIEEAVVATGEDSGGDRYLCAYFVSRCGMDIARLRAQLAEGLPDYMVPAYFMELERMPLNTAGKVDHKALPQPEIKRENRYVAPGDDVEECLTEIWAGVLHLEKETVGIDDNFFTLGGHSLKATILVSRIHKELDVQLPLAEIFRNPTVRGQRQAVKRAEESLHIPLEAMEEKEYYPLSSAQKRLYVIRQMEGRNSSYNMPMFVQVDGEIDKEKLAHTFRLLIQRHQGFRTSFEMVNMEPVQRVHRVVAFESEYFSLDSGGAEKILAGFVRPFELSQPPLLRVGLIKLEDAVNRHILLMDMHHIISDGISHGIFVKDFVDMYEGKELSPLKLQYRDFSQWQNSRGRREIITRHQEYWLNKYGGRVPMLNLPLDYSRPTVYNFEGARRTFKLTRQLAGKLDASALESGVTLNILLLAAYYVFLAKITNQDDLVVGVPTSGRLHADLENIVGFFANMLAMRNKPGREKQFDAFLEEVKNNCLDAYENQEAQFDQLITKLDIRREAGRHPLVETVLVVQKEDGPAVEFREIAGGCLKMTPYKFQGKISHFDLMYHVTAVDGNIEGVVEYRTSLFKASTIDTFTEHFIYILEQLTE